MEYDLFDDDLQVNLLKAKIQELERQHFEQALNKIANPNNKAAQSNFDDTISKLETAINSLKDKLSEYDQAIVDKPPLEKAPPLAPTPNVLDGLDDATP